MRVNIPYINNSNKVIDNKQSITLIGANGAGKTRMSVWIENNNSDKNVHRISAQKSLNMPLSISPKDIDVASDELHYGYHYENNKRLTRSKKNLHRWSSKPETAMLNDFDKLLTYLVTEDYQKSIEFRQKHMNGENGFTNTTKLDLIKNLWEKVITHRKLNITAGKIETSRVDEEEYYNGSEMSDGERAIFYFIGEVLSAPQDSIIIIDEPENHLHRSVLVKLWNSIEDFRNDCVFIYITHNLEFATSRLDSQIIWVKEYHGDNNWDYEIIDSGREIPEALMLEMIGSRENVLFIEGKPDSYDFKLYSELFKEYTVIPVESCQSVIQSTKSFNQLNNLHNLNAKGIIDRDRKTDEMIEKYNEDQIYCPLVAEVESFFLIPEVVEQTMKHLLKEDKEIEDTLEYLKEGIIRFLANHKEEQAILFTKQIVQNKLNEVSNYKINNINDYDTKIKNLQTEINVIDVYSKIILDIDSIIESKNYLEALKIINNKGLLPESGILSKIKLKKEVYIDTVIRLIRCNREEGKQIREILKNYIIIQ